MRKIVLLAVTVLFFACRIYAQEGKRANSFNFTRFTDDKVNITPELDSLTDKEYKSHREYGVLPFNAPCQDCVELLQKRDETHRYFVKTGSKGKVFYQQSSYGNLSYPGASGALRTIDPRMKPTGKPGVFEAKNQPLPVTINIPERFTSIMNAGKELQVNRDVNIYVKHKDGSLTSLGVPDWSNYTAGDNGIIVHNFYPGIDLEMQLGAGRVESFYLLNKPLQLGDGWLVIRDNMKVPQGLVFDYTYSAKRENNSYEGTLFMNDQQGTNYFYIGTPAAYDENNEHDNAINLDYQIADNGVYDLYIPIDWMSDPARSYPLVIDPFVTATSVLPEATITGSRYNAVCFANGCQYTLQVAVPQACDVIAMTYSFNYTATGTCNLNQGAWDLTWGGCRSPSNGTTWHTCTIGLPGLCILDSLSCFSDFQSCLTPQCAAYNIPMVLTFYRCVQNIAGCGFSCIMAETPWTMTVTGRTVEVVAQNASVCKGSCVDVSATASWGVLPYTYTWTPGNETGSPTSVCPATTTVYTVTASTCGGLATATATDTVTVFPDDNPGFTIVPNPACQNSSITVTGNGNAAATSYSWLSPGGNPASTNDQQSFNVTYPSSGNDNITLQWKSPTSGCVFDSTLQVTVNPIVVPSVHITGNPNPICPGTNVTFNATVTNGGANPTYQWYINGNQVGGATSNPFSSSTLHNGDVVTVHIISNAPCPQPDSAVSNAVTMVVNPNVTPSAVIAAVPSGPICAGTNVVFTVTPTNGGTNPSYQWYLNGNPVGTNSTTYSSSTLANGDQIVVHLLNSNVNCVLPDSAVSNIITIVLSAVIPPTVNIVAAPSDTICPGTNVTFTATPNNGGANPKYQWYLNGNPVGTNSTTYSSSTLNNGDVITVHLLNAVAPCVSPDTAVSNVITIVYSPPIAPMVGITVAPSDTICPGTNVTFSATPTNGGANPGYQWYLNGNSVGGANSATYSSSGLNNGDVISVHLLNAVGPCISPDSAVSNTITIVYSPPIAPIVSIIANPPGSICPGTNVTFTATPTNGGADPDYQWYLDGNKVGTNSASFSSSTLVAGDAIEVHLLNATGPCISPDSAVSNIITITISPLIAPTINITGADTICPGQNITFTATITNGGSDPGYQWYLNGNQVGGANSTYSSTAFNNGDVITVDLINAIGPCISPDSAVSNSLTVVYNPPVVPAVNIVAVPAGIICQGQTVTFTATGTGGGPTPSYQWYINSVATGPNDTVFSYSSFKNGDVVSVVLTSDDPCANPTTANSNQITIQMYPPMSVVATGDTTICPGESVPINAVAGGGEGAPYIYSWDNGGGNDSAEIVTPALTTTYAVSATDDCGSTPAADSVTVIVSPVPVPNFSYAPTDPTEYSRTVYFTDQSKGAVTWNWNFGDEKSVDDSSTAQNPNHVYSGVGTYTVELIVTNAAGCIDSISYTLEVTDEYTYYIPNAFTPNGDGINDYFAPQGTHDLIYEMTIYDRWGDKIFETIDTSLPWSGTVTGSNKIAEAGVYVYRIRFTDSRYTSDVLVGSVTLVR